MSVEDVPWAIVHQLDGGPKSGEAECLRCGVRMPVLVVGQNLDMAISNMGIFGNAHRDCREPDIRNED